MGRIRTIKPEILVDRKAAQLSHAAWRLWVSVWVIADDLGRLPADPAFLAGQVFWGQTDAFGEASRALASLRESSMVEIYEVRGESYMQIKGWRRHQKIDKPSGPKFPGPIEPVTQQPLPFLANPREASRTFDPDHDHDHDRDHDHEPRSEGPDPDEERRPARAQGALFPGPGESRQDDAAAAGTAEPAKRSSVQPGAAGEPVEPAKRQPPTPPDQAFTLAHLLLELITLNHPSGRLAKMPERTHAATAERWAVTLDKLRRLDGMSWGEIEGMIVWSQRDRFWQGVILGADNLRDKWDTMSAQRARKPDGGKGAGPRRGPTALALDEVAELERQEAEALEREQTG